MDEFSYSFAEYENLLDESKIEIHVTQGRRKKMVTEVRGLSDRGIDAKSFLKYTKKKCSCNGYLDKNGSVCLQGNHKDILAKILESQFSIGKNSIVTRGLV